MLVRLLLRINGFVIQYVKDMLVHYGWNKSMTVNLCFRYMILSFIGNLVARQYPEIKFKYDLDSLAKYSIQNKKTPPTREEIKAFMDDLEHETWNALKKAREIQGF